MAEFKLGRIRFVWKGDWSSSTTYYKDDVVRYGGKTFICAVGHTSDSSFYVDLDYSPTRWNQMTDGQEWRGDWATETLYSVNDVVKYGGLLYICATSHTSAATAVLGLEADQAKWTLYAEGFDWKGDWDIDTRYKLNDIVKYGGYTYVCNTGHTSAGTLTLGLENDQAKWDSFNQGLEFKGNWASLVRYKLNDIVKVNGSLWICTAGHDSTVSFVTDSATYWDEFVKGFEYESDWNVATTYYIGDVVKYGGNQYVAKTNHVGQVPSTSSANWDLFTEGFNFLNDWDVGTSYKIGDVVRLNGYTYLASADSPSVDLVITSANTANDRFTADDTTGMTTGQMIEFTGIVFGGVLASARYYVKDVVSSTEFTITDSYGGSVFNLTTATGTMVGTVGAIPPHPTYWTRLSSGVAWQGEWRDDVEYVQGDSIRFGANAYICVLNHRSEGDDGSSIGAEGGGAANSRPDLDTTGTYWNLLSIGSETDVLSVRGDLVYFGGSGPTRLPVGSEGQVLRAGENDPEWVTLGNIDHVYYVAGSGTDGAYPVWGSTLDKPFKTIRYAAMQIEKGARNPNAKSLLELNRVFIQREVTEYIQYQIANAGVGSIWENFEYNDNSCERDVGLAVDALIWDVTHGGNVKTRGVANSLVGAITEDTPGAYPDLAVEKDQSIAAYNYMLTVINNVLAQEAPSTNYQTENGDNSTSVVEQHFDATITVESGVTTTIASLVTIITNAIEDEDASRVPARFVPASLIKVATGQYREVLPIIVPERTCVLGDELRSTNIGPATGSTDITDATYSIASLGRIEEIIGDVIKGTDVTETTGNTEVQSRDFPFADTPQETKLKRLVRAIQHNIDFRLGTTALTTSADPTGYNSSYLNGYGDARKNIKENKKFLQEEVIAYITANYSSIKYSKTKCRQDTGYIVDAIVYDLTYGGNTQTINAGLAYYDGSSGALQIDSSEKVATIAAYNFLKTRLQQLATAAGFTPLQQTIGRFTGTAGSAASSTQIGVLMDTITEIVQNGTTSAPNITVTSITGTDTLNTATSHNLTVGDTFTPRTTTNGLVKNRKYWVVATPSGTSFELADSFGGSAITLTNGTGLTIVGNVVDTPPATNGVTTTTALITAAETLDAAQETIVRNVIDDLNAEAYHTDFTVETTSLTSTDFQVYVGKNDITHTYVSGGTVTLADDTTRAVSNFVYNESTGFAVVTTSTAHGLEAGDIVNITGIVVSCTSSGETRQFTYPSATSTDGQTTKVLYVQNKCLRDTRLILEAVMYDFMFNSNFQSYKAAYAYLRASASEVYTLSQKKVTRNALENARTEAIANVGADATAIARINTYMELIDDVIYTGSNEGSNCASSFRNDDYAYLQLERNRAFIVAEIDAWIADTYSDTATATTASTNAVTISDTSWLKRNAAIRFSGTALGGLSTGVTYYVQNVITSTTFTVATTRYASTPITLTDDTGSSSVALYYNSALCLRDVNSYIDAVKYDLKYAGAFINGITFAENECGNYRSLLAARYYANSVTGSLEEDQFYLRDSTGVRDATLEGLTGDLLAPNEYGTSRVSAGAYCSLDPGWGPDDYRTWINTRSPYVQGITTLGTAAIGQKIDGALHNGGNDSIVSNDFTQVISDGIGAWVANNGRAELVSVFTYYAHIGYLSTEGGRIRGTNGNNSYGDFGSVAEGFDSRETPDTAVVDNRLQFKATTSTAITDGDKFNVIEFDNAGIDYTEVSYTYTGGGTGAESENNEFRDDAVFEVRLLDLGDDSSGQFGGEGYLTNSNTAQAGTTSSITLAATDGETSTAYPGMKVVVTGGTGAGQYGIVDTYNSGTKVAQIVRESDGQSGFDHFINGTTIVAPDASSTYTMEPALSFTSPDFSAEAVALNTSATWLDVVYGDTTATYSDVAGTYTGTGSDATFDVVRNGSKYIPSVSTAGTGYTRLETITLAGSDLGGTDTTNDIVITITAVNSVTGAILEFDWDGYGKGGVYVATSTSGTASYSNDGETWQSVTSMPSANGYAGIAHGLLDDGSSDQKVSMFVAIGSGNGSASNYAAYSTNGVDWFANVLPASATWVDITFGEGRFVAIADDNTTVAISLDGIVWDVTGTLNATGFNSVAYGAGKFVAVKAGDTNAVEYSTDGVSWAQDDMPANSTWTSVTFGTNVWVAVASDSNSGAVSSDGATWIATTIGSPDSNDPAGFQNVKYGQGVFLVTSTLNGQTGYQYVMKSENGIYWTDESVPTVNPGGSPQVDGYNAIAFGNPQRTGTWVAISNDAGTHAVKIRTGAKTRARAFVAEEKIFAIRIIEPGSGYDTTPTLTVTDPNNIYELPTEVRTGSGVLAQPNWINRGTGYTTGNAEVDTGDGYADFYQTGGFVAVRRLSARPVAGSNVVFADLPGRTFKLVNVLTFLGENDGAYTAFLQVSPTLEVSESPEDQTGLNTRLRYSQVRLTGHDFLDIGTGNFVETNYPGTPTQDPIPANETVEGNGGRVFYTSTDQDGNFRVGDLFSIEQSTGVATLNADAFNISGLQELNLGNVTLGGGSATVTEFSTDPFFTADSDNVIPTQRAIKAYIASQIGGGGASLNVNSVTAGSIFISSNQISHVTNGAINMNAVFEFRRSVTGYPIAFNYFLN